MTYDDTKILVECTLAILSRIIAGFSKRNGRVLLCVENMQHGDLSSQPQDRLEVGLACAFRKVPHLWIAVLKRKKKLFNFLSIFFICTAGA
jgi:hypothetical protein